jgi:hypothetical protein
MQEVERNKEINVIEATRVFVSLPRTVIVPYDNIGLIEEAPFPFVESTNAIGADIKLENNVVVEKFPIFKPYYSEEVGGFCQSPVLVKNKFPFKIVKGGNIVGGNNGNASAEELQETDGKKE